MINFLDLKSKECANLTQWPDNTICLIEDTIDEEHLCALLDKLGTPFCIMHNSSVNYQLPKPHHQISVLCLSIFGELQNDDFMFLDMKSNLPDTCFNFCFSANRANINRFLCIKLLQYFGLSNFIYSWSGCGREFDCSGIIDSLDAMSVDKSHFLSPISNFDPCWIDTNHNTKKTPFVFDYACTNVENFVYIRHLFTTSLFQLVLGSPEYQHIGWICEKALQAFVSMNVPIFVGGGYKQAEVLRTLGYDVFDDVVDHSYETEPDLFKRCYLAFKLNLHLLQDPRPRELRLKLYPRLLENQQKVLKTNLCKQYNQKLLKLLDSNLRQTIVNKIYPYTIKQNQHRVKQII